MSGGAGQAGYRLLLKTAAGPGGVTMATRPMPTAQGDNVLVRVRCAAVCGTDLHILQWNEWAARAYRLPLALGHEFSGEIVALGEAVEGLRVGDHVCAETHLACGTCAQCRIGRGHTCLNLRVFSRLDQGAFGEYTLVPAQLLRKLPAGLSHRHGSLMEPLGIAVRAVVESGAAGGTLLVSGCGPIGLLAIVAARALGVAAIAATDLSPARRELAAQLGARWVFDPRETSLSAMADADLPGGCVDAVVEASGAPSAVRSALELARPGGTVVLAGLPAAPLEIDLARHVILREVALRGIYGRELRTTWHQVETLLPHLTDALDRIVTHRYALHDFEQAFATARSGDAGKVQFLFD